MSTGFLDPITDQQVNDIKTWCLREFGGWLPTDAQVQEVWQNYRGGETRFTPSAHFDGLTSMHVSGLVLAIEKVAL